MKIKEHFKEVAVAVKYRRKQEAYDGSQQSQQAQSSDAASIQHIKGIA